MGDHIRGQSVQSTPVLPEQSLLVLAGGSEHYQASEYGVEDAVVGGEVDQGNVYHENLHGSKADQVLRRPTIKNF